VRSDCAQLKSTEPGTLTEAGRSKRLNGCEQNVLAQYTWMEQDIISIKGEQKKEELYNVQLGHDPKLFQQ